MYGLILFFHVLVSIVLVVIILLQQSGGTGMASVFGGGGGTESIFGSSGAAPFMVKVTTALAVVFVVTSLSLVLISAQRARETGVLEQKMKQLQQEAAPQSAPIPFDEAIPESIPGGE